MTGGGFGGCVIALIADEKLNTVVDAVQRAVAAAGYTEPAIARTHAAAVSHRPGRGSL